MDPAMYDAAGGRSAGGRRACAQLPQHRFGYLLLEQVLAHPSGKLGTQLPLVLPLLQWTDGGGGDINRLVQLRVMVEKALLCVADAAAQRALQQTKDALQAIHGDDLPEAQVTAIQEFAATVRTSTVTTPKPDKSSSSSSSSKKRKKVRPPVLPCSS
jgi:hypothetical protein